MSMHTESRSGSSTSQMMATTNPTVVHCSSIDGTGDQIEEISIIQRQFTIVLRNWVCLRPLVLDECIVSDRKLHNTVYYAVINLYMQKHCTVIYEQAYILIWVIK
ncbi:hypothetical protein XELAEV_18017721mg [Xenopus laevis]|uniref:Uncharacterized protein n=1 Tax=Xenopus laevis TaxID=8355 RepID=A0A974HT51_XENLA|nr:hypothetical protein XELAEV_18017721mg [Xenopus laevis]